MENTQAFKCSLQNYYDKTQKVEEFKVCSELESSLLLVLTDVTKKSISENPSPDHRHQTETRQIKQE